LWHVQKITAKYRYDCEHRSIEIFIMNGKQPGDERYQDEPVDQYHLKTEQTPIKDFAFN